MRQRYQRRPSIEARYLCKKCWISGGSSLRIQRTPLITSDTPFDVVDGYGPGIIHRHSDWMPRYAKATLCMNIEMRGNIVKQVVGLAFPSRWLCPDNFKRLRLPIPFFDPDFQSRRRALRANAKVTGWRKSQSLGLHL